MNEIIKFFDAISTQMPDYLRYIHIILVASIILVTEGIKIPIKHFLINKIENKSIRDKVNMVFMIIPFGLGLLGSYILTLFGYAFSYEAGIMWGFVAEIVFEFIERIFKRIKQGNGELTSDTLKEDFKEAEKKTKEASRVFDKLVEEIKSNDKRTKETGNKVINNKKPNN